MAKVTHVSQFAHDIAVRVLERFDKYGVCATQLAQDADGDIVSPTSPDASCVCITGRIVNAFPDIDGGYYSARSVREIARTITGDRTTCAFVLYARNDRLFKEVGPVALRERTRRLFKRIAALPVVDENPTEFRVGGVYEQKANPGNRYTVLRVRDACSADIPSVLFEHGGWDPVYAISAYRRVA